MIIDLAMVRWKDDVTKKEINAAMNDIRALQDKVDGIALIKCGENTSPLNEGFTHTIIVLARDSDALDAYRNHPDYRAVAQRIEAMKAESKEGDFADED